MGVRPDLGLGEDDDVHHVYRCAQCLFIVGYHNGGFACTDLPLGDDERRHLEQCCDDCWVKIVKPLEDATRRLVPPKGQLKLVYP